MVQREPIRGNASGRRARKGFTIVELSIAISIMMIGLVSVVASTSRMHLLRRQNRELTLANNGMRTMAERIHASAYGFSNESGNWSNSLVTRYSAGGAFGNTFEVTGLTPVTGEPAVGTITIVTDERTTDATLQARLGMPRDLNGDGAADDPDVTTDARILPVQLTVRWRSKNRENELRHGFYILGY